MKAIVNVYKGAGLWQKPPPGIGDFLRGCAYLLHISQEGRFAGRFEPRVNLDLAPGANCLALSDLHQTANRADLIGAKEYFHTPRDGDVEQTIAAFLDSDRDVLYVSTNQSWRGVDDAPPRQVLDRVARIVTFTPPFARLVAERNAHWGQNYTLLHIRDADRGALNAEETDDEKAYRARAQRFVERALSHAPPGGVVCISNNQRLRNFLCANYNLSNPHTAVMNTGFIGTLSEAELMDIALIKGARVLYALSYFGWNSGFSVWTCRLFGIQAVFANAFSKF